MCRRKLNLSIFKKLVWLLSLICSTSIFAQRSVVSVNILGGRIVDSETDFPVSSFTGIRSSGNQRTFIINSVITLTITTTGSTCNSNNGSLIAVASGGTAPYTFALSNGWVFQTGNFPFLAAGNYTLTVTDAIGQTATAGVTITNSFSPPLYAMPVYQPASGCAMQNASVTLSATGGTPPYQYSMDEVNYQAGNTFSNLYPGFYTFFVKDANGCTVAYNAFSMNYLMNPSCDVSIGLTYTDRVCGNDGFIQGGALGPGGPFLYSLDGVNYQSILNYNNLVAGTYYLHIKYANGSIAILAFVMRPSCAIRIDYITVDAACLQNDGILTATASYGTAPYTYTLDGVNFQASNVFTGLSPGNYFITVRDANGYRSSLAAVLYDRCPAVTLTATNETCVHNDGTITATATKGTPPYQYSIDGVNFQSSNIFTGLAAATFTITLKDALGFTTTGTISINYNCLAVTTIHTNVVCGNGNGTITATGSGGTAPYQYSINGINFQSSNIFNDLGSGTYTVIVKDATGQMATTTVIITNTPGPFVIVTTTPTSCTVNDGTLTITPVGGTPPYTYTLDNINYQASNIFTNLWVNNYFASAKDANGCEWGISHWVEWDCPNITTNVTNESCGSANGTISVTVANATPPFQYSLDGINFQTSPVFTGLIAGSYTITVRTAINHINTATVTIGNTCPVVSATASDGTCGNSNGSIIATGANGITPYQYSIDGINFQTSNVFNGLAAGLYTVTIKDAGNVTGTTTISVGNIPGPQIITSSVPASCVNNNGAITVTGNGGTLPFQFSIDGTNYQVNNVFNSLASGNYTAWVKDANGCFISRPVTIVVDTNLTLSTGTITPVCEGKSTTLPAVSNGTNFTWSPASGLNDIHLLNPLSSTPVPAKYYIIAKLGVCTKVDSVNVVVNAAPIPFAGKDSTICYGQSIQLNGTGGLNYEWTPATYLSDQYIINPTVVSPPSSITYYLKVTDGNGCTSLQASPIRITVTPMAKVFAGNDTSIVMNQPFVLTAKDINNSGFIGYNWSPPDGLNNTAVQNPVAILDRNITYTITAVTAKGCRGTDDITIKVYKGPEIYLPNAFSPNNDGRNDVLKAILVGIKEFKYFVIYNRWGQREFYTSDPTKGWDGRIKNTSQDTGTFVWMAEGVDDKGHIIIRKGTVILIR
jgi:gliding motility-associated-like protein